MAHPTEDAIRARAYELWERNGRMDGRDIDYWLQAARELEEEERLTRSEDNPLFSESELPRDDSYVPPYSAEESVLSTEGDIEGLDEVRAAPKAKANGRGKMRRDDARARL